jgi:hypothetical protein
MRKSDMRRSGTKADYVLLAAFYVSACTGAYALTAPPQVNPYEGIVTRNVFGLKPMPVAAAPEPQKAPAPKYTLTGIMDMDGRKRALFKAQLPAKPPEPAHEQSYMLAEGEKDGDMEVVEIDKKAGSIRVKYSGEEMTVEFSKDSSKAGTLAAAPAANPFAVPAVAPANPFAPPAASGGAAVQTIPTRTVRTTQAGASTSGYPGEQAPGGQQLGQALVQAAADSPDKALSPEESVLMSAANRLKREQEWRDQGRTVPHLPVHPVLQGLGLFDNSAQQPAQPPAPVFAPGR